jgi:hypothetical protein
MMYKMAVAVDDEVPNPNSLPFDSDGIVRWSCHTEQEDMWRHQAVR